MSTHDVIQVTNDAKAKHKRAWLWKHLIYLQMFVSDYLPDLFGGIYSSQL